VTRRRRRRRVRWRCGAGAGVVGRSGVASPVVPRLFFFFDCLGFVGPTPPCGVAVVVRARGGAAAGVTPCPRRRQGVAARRPLRFRGPPRGPRYPSGGGAVCVVPVALLVLVCLFLCVFVLLLPLCFCFLSSLPCALVLLPRCRVAST